MGNRRHRKTRVRLMQEAARVRILCGQYKQADAHCGNYTDDEGDSVFLSRIGCHNQNIIFLPIFLVI